MPYGLFKSFFLIQALGDAGVAIYGTSYTASIYGDLSGISHWEQTILFQKDGTLYKIFSQFGKMLFFIFIHAPYLLLLLFSSSFPCAILSSPTIEKYLIFIYNSV